MDADFSVELGGEDPVLDFPWTDASGRLAYFDLKRHPELLAQVEEAKELPELAEFLRCVNSARSAVESAKCDVWATQELTTEEEVFGASHARNHFPRHHRNIIRQSLVVEHRRERGTPAEAAEGDGLLVVRDYGDATTATVFFVNEGKLYSGIPADFHNVDLR